MVIDTNAVLDLWAFCDPGVAVLRADLEAGRLDWVGCPAMRQELERVLERGVAAAHGADPQAVLHQWDRWVRQVRFEPGTRSGPGHRLQCRDGDDQMFLDLALDEGAQGLLTSDRDLLSLRRRAARLGLHIRRPQEWLGTGVQVQGQLQG